MSKVKCFKTMDLNKVMIIGRLTRDPELRTTPSGISVCQLGVATNFVYTNQQSGQKVEQVEYHNITLWRKLGEIAHQYLKKGAQVYIEGRLQTRSWDAADGQKKSRTEIIADNMIMLARPAGASGSAYSSADKPAPAPSKADDASQSPPSEELPTIQQDEPPAANVEDIPF